MTSTTQRPVRPAAGLPDPVVPPGPSGGPVPVAPPPKLRRRPMLIVASIVLVLVGAVVTGWAYSSLGNAREVVAVRVTVPRGQVITRDVLQTVRIGVDPAIAAVPASEVSSIVGKRAAYDLVAGGLLPRDAVTDKVTPGADQSVVGLSLAPGTLPSVPLLVGDKVRIVSTPGAQGEVKPAELRTFDGTVAAIGTPDGSGKVTVSVLVPASQAAELAARSATGRVALLLDSRER